MSFAKAENAVPVHLDTRSSIFQGLLAVWPVCFGYIPLGLAMGVLGEKAGLSPLQVGVMSITVFAGSGQFIAVSMIAAGASVASIIATTFMINLRHLLMSSSLAVYSGKTSRKKLSLFCHGIVDETFAVNLDRFRKGAWDWDKATIVNYAAHLAWILSTTAGCYCGRLVPANAFGLDYALPAMFISLLIFQLNGAIYVLTALLSGLLAVVFAIRFPGNSYIVIASVTAATLGVAIRRSRKKEQKR